MAPRHPHCSLSLHCAALESVIFHNIRVRKSFMASLGVGAWEWNKSSAREVEPMAIHGYIVFFVDCNTVTVIYVVL